MYGIMFRLLNALEHGFETEGRARDCNLL